LIVKETREKEMVAHAFWLGMQTHRRSHHLVAAHDPKHCFFVIYFYLILCPRNSCDTCRNANRGITMTEAEMKLNWKHTAGAFALSVAMLGMAATGPVTAKGKSGTIPPPPVEAAASVEKGKSGTIKMDPVQGEAPPSAEKGIKDPAIKSCGSCGVTGREAAPPPVDDAAAPGSEQRKFNDQWSGAPPSVEKGKSGTIPIEPPTAGAQTERRAHEGPGGTPPSTVKKGKTGWILAVASAAALAAVLASGNNDGNPTSP
jgi:hypothetical protein